MSGHSKWATTKRKKAVIDAKRSKVFTKVAKLITIAARDGKSGDPVTNPSLRLAIENARSVSMPKENIDRAIKRGVGGGEGANQIEEVFYEAYAPGGIALLIECLTDNRNRTLGEIKAILGKAGGSLASAGSVSYLFKQVGQILIDASKNQQNAEELEMAIIESGAEDFEKEDSTFIVITNYQELTNVAKHLQDVQIIIESSEIVYIPNSYVGVQEGKQENIERIIESLDDLDDINNVYTNADL